MTDIDKTIPVWVDNDGVKTQVGWATPDNGSGVRKINLLDGFDNTALKNVHFGDVDAFETELEPAETQEPPRTFQEFAAEPFVDIDGDVLAPALDETPGFVDTTPEPVDEPTFQEPVVEVTPEAPVVEAPAEEPQVEVAPEAAAPVENAPEEAPLPSEPIEEVPNEELAAEPIDAGVAPEETAPVENAPEEEVVEAEIVEEEAPVVDDSNDEEWVEEYPTEEFQDDSGDAEDVPAGFEPVSAAPEPEQSEDPAQP